MLKINYTAWSGEVCFAKYGSSVRKDDQIGEWVDQIDLFSCLQP